MASKLSEEIAQRILCAREKSGMTQREVAEQLNVKETTYANWEKGRAQPNVDTIYSLCKLFNESFDEWLGLKPSYSDSKPSSLVFCDSFTDFSDYSTVNLSPDEKKLLSLWRQASHEGQQAALAVLSTCVSFKKQNEKESGVV